MPRRAISRSTKKPKGTDRYPQLEGTWGLSGIGMFMTITKANSKNPDDPMNAAPPSGLPGKYKVVFVLSRPGYNPLKENHISFEDDLRGDSHLFVGDPNQVEVQIEAKLPDGNVTLFGAPNEKGFLGKVEIEEIGAQGFGDANLKAYNALATVLSRLSLLADVPLHIFRITTIELSTQNRMSSLTLPFVEQRSPMFTDYEPDKELANFASLYREALNSNSPNYQFLSYFKIIEGIRRIRESRTTQENQEASAKGEKPPSREREILPTSTEEKAAWLNSVLTTQKWSDLALLQVFPTEVTGKKLNEVIKTSGVLDMIRNRIAHAVTRDETKETINIDDGLLISEVTNFLPLCKCIARYLLKKEYPPLFGA
jgi:hypothetical protein